MVLMTMMMMNMQVINLIIRRKNLSRPNQKLLLSLKSPKKEEVMTMSKNLRKMNIRKRNTSKSTMKTRILQEVVVSLD
jgi:hypothetical protein